MSTYSILINILDKIRSDAPGNYKTYKPNQNEIEKLNFARSKAFIHLFLKSNFGLIDFLERESFVTDGTNDGGIDGYYIESSSKRIYFIQSKFRTTETNFLEKKISLEEILKMDIDRILDGETKQENSVEYNAKIKKMQNRISSIPDIGRYSYQIIILANIPKIAPSKLRLLSAGFPCEVYNYQRTYSELVFPVVSGTYYNHSDLTINVNLLNKSAGSKISYNVETQYGNCDITALFIPTSEIGKLMYQYKNSILKFNPRSFLTLKEGSINDEIRKTIIESDTNEFALYNNGLTILSDETYFNEKIGQKDKAQLILKNPQIINGGQTAYTLSLIYEESINEKKDLAIKLESKEVLVKIITFGLDKEISNENRLDLIESISEATNKQNLVNNADRSSNNSLLISTQKSLFNDFGLLLERKRGEFYDGIKSGYIDKKNLIDRGIFMRVVYATKLNPVPPKKEKALINQKQINDLLDENSDYKKYYFGCLCFKHLLSKKSNPQFGNALSSGVYSVIAVCSTFYNSKAKNQELNEIAINSSDSILLKWEEFEQFAINQYHNKGFFKFNFNYNKQSFSLKENFRNYYRSNFLPFDLNNFFFQNDTKINVDENYRKKVLNTDDFLSLNDLSSEDIRNIQNRINKNNWFDRDHNTKISEELGIDNFRLNNIISKITSREHGYYFQKYYLS